MNRKLFFDHIRTAVFNGRLTQGQVDGLNRLIEVWTSDYGDYPDAFLAYCLGTGAWETGYTMQPITERGPRSYFNKYEPGTRLGKILGNTQAGDGYRFRGEGDVQNTGRRNARYSSARLREVLGVDVDFEKNPELRGDPIYSAHCLFLGCIEGWYTGVKLADFIDGIDESDEEDGEEFRQARRVVNGTNKDVEISELALDFEEAINLSQITGEREPDVDPLKLIIAGLEDILTELKSYAKVQ